MALVQPVNHLAIGPGGEREAAAFQLHAQLGVVVDLPVERDQKASAGGAKGLLAPGDVGDRQPGDPKAGEVQMQHPPAIRPAGLEALQSAGDELGVGGEGGADAAHIGGYDTGIRRVSIRLAAQGAPPKLIILSQRL